MRSFFRRYRALKITVVILLLAGIALFITGQYLSRHYRTLLLDKLPEITARATDSLYRVSAGDIQVHVLSRTISVFRLRLSPDPAVVARRRSEGKLPDQLFDISIREVELSGLKVDEGAALREIKCRLADIYHPIIKVTRTDSASHRNASQAREARLKSIFVKALNIYDPEFSLADEQGAAAVFHSKGGRIGLEEWLYEPGKAPDTARLLYAKGGTIQLCDIGYRQPGTKYQLHLDTLEFASGARTAVFKGTTIKPTVSRTAFYEDENMQKEIYEGSFPLIRLHQFQWEALMQRGAFIAGQADLDYPVLDIYFSRLYPPNTASKVGNYPHELLQQLAMPLQVPLINLYRGSFHYTEVSEKTKRPGILDFGSISGVITGLSNQPRTSGSDDHCYIKFTCHFMRKGSLGVVFDFPLDATEGAFKVSGQLRNLDGEVLSEAALALALAEIKSLKLHQLDFAITGDDSSAAGDITIRYNDLKVKIKKIDQATRRMRNRGFISFVANKLVLYNDNPMAGEPVRVAHTHLLRDPTKSFFNLIWKNLFAAGVQTAVRQEGLTDIVNKTKANKGKQKLHFFRKLFPKRKLKPGQRKRASRNEPVR